MGAPPAGSGSETGAGGDRRVPHRRPVWVCCLPVQNADPSLGHGVWSHGARKPSMRVSPSLPHYGEPPRPPARLLQRARHRRSAVCLSNAASRPPACRPGTERDPGTGGLALSKTRTFLNWRCPQGARDPGVRSRASPALNTSGVSPEEQTPWGWGGGKESCGASLMSVCPSLPRR